MRKLLPAARNAPCTSAHRSSGHWQLRVYLCRRRRAQNSRAPTWDSVRLPSPQAPGLQPGRSTEQGRRARAEPPYPRRARHSAHSRSLREA